MDPPDVASLQREADALSRTSDTIAALARRARPDAHDDLLRVAGVVEAAHFLLQRALAEHADIDAADA